MFYLIDKPINITSFGVLRKLRKILDIRKIGHTGTLDPFASGCLIVATGKSTKLIPMLESSTKEYIATIRFDGKTESYDTETPVLPVDLSNFSWKSHTEIENFLLYQTSQSPPRYSAIHVDGKRSYELARKGKEFTLKERPIKVFEVKVLEQSEFSITLKMLVSSGCYMRSFGPLLGNYLGTDGGYLTQLQRTKILGRYSEIGIEECDPLENPEGISYSKIFHTIHTYEVSEEIMIDIRNGKRLPIHVLGESTLPEDLFFIRNIHLSYVSLAQKMNDEIVILKNDVE